MKDFRFAIWYSIISVFAGGFVSFFTGSLSIGFFAGFMAGVLISISLGVTESSMSMDNSIINAPLLRKLDPFWKRNYNLFGMPVAVIGMRFLFPIVMVSITTGLSLYSTLNLAIHNPTEYAHHLDESKYLIVGFGIAFLSLIFGDFMFDPEKEDHWFAPVERVLSKIGHLPYFKFLFTAILFDSVGFYSFEGVKLAHFLMAGFVGVISYCIVKVLSSYAESKTEGSTGGGFIGFLQLELIDASFSFDGVIGAFAITQNIFQIAIGLGIGAVWVRSLTRKLADSDAFAELKFLGHGAFWNIGSLIVFMSIGLTHNLPEWIPGLVAVVIIGLSFWHSKKAIEE